MTLHQATSAEAARAQTARLALRWREALRALRGGIRGWMGAHYDIARGFDWVAAAGADLVFPAQPAEDLAGS
jgi:hypothetical protein